MREQNESVTWHVQSQRHTRMHVVVLHVDTYVRMYVYVICMYVCHRGEVKRCN